MKTRDTVRLFTHNISNAHRYKLDLEIVVHGSNTSMNVAFVVGQGIPHVGEDNGFHFIHSRSINKVHVPVSDAKEILHDIKCLITEELGNRNQLIAELTLSCSYACRDPICINKNEINIDEGMSSFECIKAHVLSVTRKKNKRSMI